MPSACTPHRWRGTVRSVAGLILLLLLAHAAADAPVRAQDTLWELKVCADPISLPFSSMDETGFENRIADILAEELNAALTYDWHIFNPDIVKLRLRQGECDLLLGVPDGFSDLVNTVAYYRSPYVFVYRANGDFEVHSLDDELLRSLRIGVQSSGIPPHEALINRRITGNVTTAYGDRAGRADRLGDLIVAVAEGEVDVGIAWGPVAAYFAGLQDVELRIVPVSPEFEPPATFMSIPMTMAVRPGDEALRDRLNMAIANRWDDIQAVLNEYTVPLEPQPKPFVGGSSSEDGIVRVGLIMPTRTGISSIASSLYEVVGEGARMGALLVEGHLARVSGPDSPEIKLLTASAPDAGTARRAAERLVTTEGVHVLIGGIGPGQAEALADAAERHRVPFLNIGSPDMRLRERSNRYVFHIEASADMYMQALIDWYESQGVNRWFVVYEETDSGEVLLDVALKLLAEKPGAEIVGQVGVVVEQPTYYNELYDARDAGADAVLLLTHAVDQVAFLSQMAVVFPVGAAASYPDPVTQTRDFLGAARVRYDAMGLAARVALWDTTLDSESADDLNMRYIGRWGKPMDPSAWAAYQAVRIVHQAVEATGKPGGDAFVDYLESPATAFEMAKGQLLSFGREDHQLRQPLYVVRPDPDAQWAITVWNQVNFAEVVAELPGSGGVYGPYGPEN